MTPEFKKHALRGAGFFFISIFSGLYVYDTPPESWGQLGVWLWQPSLQGALAALTSLGLNAATENSKRK